VWTAEEDALLVQLYQESGTQWSRISKQVEGRTAQQCRARFFQLKAQDSSIGHPATQPAAAAPAAPGAGGGAGPARARSGAGASGSGRGRPRAREDEDEFEYDAEFESLGNWRPRSSRRQISARRTLDGGAEDDGPRAPKRRRSSAARPYAEDDAPAGAREPRARSGAAPLRALSPNRLPPAGAGGGKHLHPTSQLTGAALAGKLGPPTVLPSLASAVATALEKAKTQPGGELRGADEAPASAKYLWGPPPAAARRDARDDGVFDSFLSSPLKGALGAGPPLFTPSALAALGVSTTDNTPSKLLGGATNLSPLRDRALATPARISAGDMEATPGVRTRSRRAPGDGAAQAAGPSGRGADPEADREAGGVLTWRLHPTVGLHSPAPCLPAGGGATPGHAGDVVGLASAMALPDLPGNMGMTPICGALPSPGGILGMDTPDLFVASARHTGLATRRRLSAGSGWELRNHGTPGARRGAGRAATRSPGAAEEGADPAPAGLEGNRRASMLRTPVSNPGQPNGSPGAGIGLGSGQTGVTLEHHVVNGRPSLGTIQKPAARAGGKGKEPATRTHHGRGKGRGQGGKGAGSADASPFSPLDAPPTGKRSTQPVLPEPSASDVPKARLEHQLEHC